MAGWVGLVGWLIADASPTKWLHGSCQSSAWIGKARRQNRWSNHYATPPTTMQMKNWAVFLFYNLWHVWLKQERDRKQFQEALKLKMKQNKAELDRISRGQPKEVKQQRRAEQEVEIAKKASQLVVFQTFCTLIVPHVNCNIFVL